MNVVYEKTGEGILVIGKSAGDYWSIWEVKGGVYIQDRSEVPEKRYGKFRIMVKVEIIEDTEQQGE